MARFGDQLCPVPIPAAETVNLVEARSFALLWEMGPGKRSIGSRGLPVLASHRRSCDLESLISSALTSATADSAASLELFCSQFVSETGRR
jgi:hypothetical protein